MAAQLAVHGIIRVGGREAEAESEEVLITQALNVDV